MAAAVDLLYRLSKIGFSYGAVTALKGLNLEFDNSSVALLGANGTGKSTLLKILNGLLFPDSGSLSFMGNTITEAALAGSYAPEFRSRVGLLFADPDVQLFNATVYDEVAFGPRQLGFTTEEVKSRTEETLDLIGIRALADRPPHLLSSGEKRKVAIATLLVVNPAVILMDEPTLGLDPRSEAWLIGLLHLLKEAGKCLIFSTHDLRLAKELADKVVVLDESHSVACFSDAQEVLSDKELLYRVNITGAPERRKERKTSA